MKLNNLIAASPDSGELTKSLIKYYKTGNLISDFQLKFTLIYYKGGIKPVLMRPDSNKYIFFFIKKNGGQNYRTWGIHTVGLKPDMGFFTIPDIKKMIINTIKSRLKKNAISCNSE